MFFALIVFAAIAVGLGGRAGFVELRDDTVVAGVISCSTDALPTGRWIGRHRRAR